MRHVEPRVDHAAAVRIFERRPLARLRGLFRSPSSPPAPPAPNARQVPYAELVWIPCYLVAIALRTRHGPDEVACTVEAHGGAFALFDMAGALRDGTPDGERFPPGMDAEAAEATARRELVHTIMRIRGGRRKSVPEQTQSVELIQYPYWVYYFRPRPGRLDIRVLDAVTGKKPGAKTKVGILSAFAAVARAKPAP